MCVVSRWRRQRADTSKKVLFSAPMLCRSVFRGFKWFSLSNAHAVRWMSGPWATSFFEVKVPPSKKLCSETGYCLPYPNLVYSAYWRGAWLRNILTVDMAPSRFSPRRDASLFLLSTNEQLVYSACWRGSWLRNILTVDVAPSRSPRCDGSLILLSTNERSALAFPSTMFLSRPL